MRYTFTIFDMELKLRYSNNFNLYIINKEKRMAKIVDMINTLTGANEAEQKKREQFTLLQKMAEAKCAEFKAELEKTALGDKNKTEIGGGRYFRYYSAQHVDISSEINDRINETINSFFKGKEGMKEGFQNLIRTSLDALINHTTIGEKTEDMFFIYPENNAIVRLDVKAYKYSFSQKGLIADCENIFCYMMGKSIIDHTTLSLDELLYFISDMSGASDNLEIVTKFTQEITALWHTLENQTPQQVIYQYQRKDIESDTSYKRGGDKNTLGIDVTELLNDNMQGVREIAQRVVKKAKELGWELCLKANDNYNLVKRYSDKINEVNIIMSDKVSIQNAIQFINDVELRDANI